MADADAGAPARSVLVIGLGNALRADDGAGIEVARRLRAAGDQAGIEVREQHGEPTELLEAWQDRDAVVLVDTMRAGLPTGTIRRFDASRDPLPARMHASSSTHALGLGEALELARSLDRLPQRVIVYAVQGHAFQAGDPLSREVEAALAALVGEVLREARELTGGAGANPTLRDR